MSNEICADPLDNIARLERELEEAEGYQQKLRERIVRIRALASGNAPRVLSLCNQTLNEIDNATDVVASSSSADDPGRDSVTFGGKPNGPTRKSDTIG